MKSISVILATIFLAFSASAAEFPEWVKQKYPEWMRVNAKATTGNWNHITKTWDAKADRITVRKPMSPNARHMGFGVTNVKYDGFIIIGDYYAPLDWHRKIIRNLKIIEEKAPDMYRVAQKYGWKIQYNGVTSPSMAARWKNLTGISLHDYNAGYGHLAGTMIHEFQHCSPIDGSQGAAYWASYHYGERVGLHPRLIRLTKAAAIGHGYSAEKWKRTFPNMK